MSPVASPSAPDPSAPKRSVARVAGKLDLEARWSLSNQFLQLVSSVAGFLLLGRALGPSSYGFLAAVGGVVAPFSAFTAAGISSAVYESIVRDNEEVQRMAGTYLSLAAVSGVGLSCVAMALGLSLLTRVNLVALSLLIVSDLLINALLTTLIAVIQATRGFIAATQSRMVTYLLRISGVALLWGTGSVTLSNVGIMQTVVLGSLVVWNFLRLRPILDGWVRFRKFSKGQVATVSRYALSTSASNIQNDGDYVALNHYGHHSVAGLYGVAYKLVQMGLLPVHALVDSTHLDFLRMPNRSAAIRKAARLSGAGVAYGLVFILIALAIRPLIRPLFGSEFAGAADMIPWLAPLVMLRAASAFALNALISARRTRSRVAANLIAAATSVLLYILLVPEHSWRGAVTATIISEIVLAAAAWAALLFPARNETRRGGDVLVRGTTATRQS